MIHCVVIFGTESDRFKGSASKQCDNLKDVEKWAKWYFEHLQVSSLFITIKGEEENDKN